MKKNITFQNILFLFLAVIALYRFSFIFAEKGEKSTETTFTDKKDGFLNYVLVRPWVDSFALSYFHITRHFDSFKELNFNASHQYGGDGTYLGYFHQDSLNDIQRDTLQNIHWQSDNKGLRCLLERARISWLCLSQRLIYETGSNNDATNKLENYGFAYQYNKENVTIDDSNRSVLHPRKNIDSAGWLCKNIYENLQHTDLYYFHPDSSDIKPWILKPEMRIDTSIFSPTDNTPVVEIRALNYNGDTISKKIIRVSNFKNINNIYKGNYINMFTDIDMSILGRRDTLYGLNYDRPGPGVDIKQCKVDFQVYWFGLVDVWFDKMIVDDTRADKLFDPNPINNYDKKIKDEVGIFKDSIIFFVGELESSQAYSTKYVKDKIAEYNIDSKLQFAVSNNLNTYSQRNIDLRSKFIMDIVKPEAMCLDAHVFQVAGNDKIYLPNNVPTCDPRLPPSWKVSSEVYNDRLQTSALGNKNDMVDDYQGTFIYQISKIRNDLRNLSPDTKFIVQPHMHSWTKTIYPLFTDEGFREPTNEEIQVQATIAISHGAQSLNWETYSSEYSANLNDYTAPQNNDPYYTILGLRDDSTTSPSFKERTSNIICQNKWNYVKAMNLKILHWKPTLDKVKWNSGYSVHYEGADYNFISDIKSIRRNPSLEYDEDYPFTYYDATNERYWEM